jgi:hypothetical protein
VNARAAGRISWTLWGASAALVALALLLAGLNRATTGPGALVTEAVFNAGVLALATVGALVSARRTGNPAGWIFLAAGCALAVGQAGNQYAGYALVTAPGSLPAGEWVAWLAAWVPAAGGSLLVTLGLLLFPTGRLPSARWRPVAWIAAGSSAAVVFGLALKPGDLQGVLPVDNPTGIEGLASALELLLPVAGMLLAASFLASVISMVLRFRRSRGEERQQLKWFAYAAVLLAAGYASAVVFGALGIESAWTGIPLGVGFLTVPTAAGIAILRYRLYDIDVIINRTLVYGTLTLSLILVYFGGVASLQYALRHLAGGESQLAVVASTLAIAALFNPLRRRIQGFIDRRFYRRKYDAKRTLEAFSARLRDETDLETLAGEVVSVAREAMQPAHVSLWLSRGEE